MQLEIRAPLPVAVVLIILFSFLAYVFLLFGAANLIHPDVPEAYLNQNTLVCLGVCGLGLASFLGAIAIARGAWRRIRSRGSD